jgi:hypothetical protein
MSTLSHLIQRALEASCWNADAVIFPAILMEWPMKPQHGKTCADLAMEYLSLSGLRCERTRMKADAYAPGLDQGSALDAASSELKNSYLGLPIDGRPGLRRCNLQIKFEA